VPREYPRYIDLTHELLRTKKISHAHERSLLEAKTKLISDLDGVRKQLFDEQHRNELVEKVIETRVNKSQEKVLSDIRRHCNKLEEDLKTCKVVSFDFSRQWMKWNWFIAVKPTISRAVLKLFKPSTSLVNNSYTSIKRRRDYEIEGFTNDILQLRKQLRTLEKSILKYGCLEDKELVLLNLARQTGERAGKISSDLQVLKAKVYSTEKEVQSLPF
jgi:coiled-coil domain-containing protein 77